MIRVGVIGVGSMGFHHARIYNQLAENGLVELVGVSDIDYERALSVAKAFKTRAFKDHRELLELVDAVSIATPTETHRDLALEFINARRHVLVEKPIASSVKDALELIEKAEENHVVLMVGHVERYNPAVIRLREIIRSGLLGEPVTITARRVSPFNPRVAKTSIIVDLAIHDIDVINSLLGSGASSIYARSRRVHPSSLEDDYGLITISYENQVDAVVETNRLTPYKMRSLEVVGSKGVAVMNYIEQKITLYDGEWIRDAIIQREEPLKLELLNFARVVEGVEKPIVTKEQATYALLIAEAALESSKKNKLICIKDHVAEKNYKFLL